MQMLSGSALHIGQTQFLLSTILTGTRLTCSVFIARRMQALCCESELASFPGHSQILSRSCGKKTEEGLVPLSTTSQTGHSELGFVIMATCPCNNYAPSTGHLTNSYGLTNDV